MKASYHWIRALVPELKATPAELAERFTRAGLEVEGMEEYGAGTKDLVVAEVKKIEPHPSRAKLKLVTIDKGGAEQRVVCGAPNVPEPGGLVCFAPLGAVLPAVGMTLTPRDIGGVTSEGMLCSERELGLVATAVKQKAGDHSDDPGILILPAKTAKPGTRLREAVPAVHDFIFEIGVTPNRPDALGHIGLAREAAALFGIDFAPPSAEAPRQIGQGSIDKLAKVTISDTERCPHYGAAMVVDVAIAPSPLWLKYRLESLGVRSISNVVDVTNLILLEFGHPMHAFDFDLVRGGSIGVRRAKPGETMKTLDGVPRTLEDDDLVIVDGEGPVALAGVMGGENSEIRASTKRVLLECAYFTPRGIRRTSRRHAIHTESSHRFERGVDPADIPDVLANAASLLTALASGKAVPGTILAGVPVAEPKRIELVASRMDALLGARVPFEDATKILTRLGFRVDANKEGATVFAPTFRPDVSMEADVIEEVMRVRGIDAIPTVLPNIRPSAPRSERVVEARVRRAAIELGLSEAVTYGFTSKKELEAIGAPEATCVLKNPLTEDRSVMRTSLLPGLFEALARARRHSVSDVRLFTVGARFLKNEEKGAALPLEAASFAAVIAGNRARALAKPEPVDAYDAKGVALEIVARATGRTASVEHQPPNARAKHLHPRAAANLIVENEIVGSFGPVHPDVADALDLGGGAVVVEIDVRALERLGAVTPKYRPIPMLPAATRDIALVVREEFTAGEVGGAIREAGKEICESVELFDLFQGKGVPEGHRSLAFHVVYRDPKAATDPEHAKTLTDAEVDARHKAIEDAVKKKFGATLRA